MTSQVEVIPRLVDEDQILAEVHAYRKDIVRQLMPQGRLPSDPAEAGNVLKVLDSMSKDALGRKRIKVEEKATDKMANASALIAEVLGAAAGKKPYVEANPVAREVPTLGSEVPAPPMVEGETAVVGGASESYETFVARVQVPKDGINSGRASD